MEDIVRPCPEEEAEEAWNREKAIMAEYRAKLEVFHTEERARAENAVAAALASYRWWGWTNIVNTIRIAIQGWRWRLAVRRNRDAKAD